MQKLTNWTAKRAGGRITINGTDAATGQPIKVVGVDEIKAASTSEPPIYPHPVATDKNGAKYELA